ncbi:hypothetical protein ACFQ0R_07495 [Psychroflexus salinarum]|uniref:Uncharacterized protein n=1 Tax=Psychroflexus salinarum TaxID=546024 RepID=A0ABW3GPN4_9FLAO
MKFSLLFSTILTFIAIISNAQDSNKIETVAVIEILNDNQTIIDNDTVPLNLIHKRVNQLLNNFDLDDNFFPSVTLIVNPSVSENSIEHIKYQIKSTPIQLINLQRKIITNYDGIEVDQNVLDQYNSLIKYWNSLETEDRFYRENELKFIESVALTMTLDQRIRNEKLPGYLPFVKKESTVPHLSMLEVDSAQSYIYVYKNDTIDKETAYTNHNDRSYFLKKRIINEEKVNVIKLIED